MPVVASIDTTQQIVTLVFAGETSFIEWQAVMDGVLSDLSYVASMCIISDRRAAENIPSTEHIRELVQYLKRHAESFAGCGIAIVAHSPVEYGMSRMAELLADGTGVRVRAFHEPESALSWLSDERHE